jgi:hypothetical protein
MKNPLNRNLSFLITACLAGLLLFTSCKKDYSAEDVVLPPVEKDHNLLLRFKAMVDTNELEFGTTYRNFFKESYSVSAFKFYVHGIRLINTDSNKVFTVNKYFLLDFSDSTTTNLKLTVQPYKYNRIGFVIGVDSARNVSGAQTDALDPAKGMFWTWNTGYIMAKLEGNSPSSPTGVFEYHIGGFREPDNVIRNTTLLFPFGETVDLKPEKTSEITVTANISNWFYNPHDLKFSENPVRTTPGPLARQIAENYSKMFTVIRVINE